MKAINSRFVLLFASACILSATTGVLADPPPHGGNGHASLTPAQRIVLRVVRAIEEHRENTRRALDRIADEGVERIRALDRAGATNERIIAVGNEISGRLNTRAAEGVTNVNTSRTNGLTELANNEGTAEQIARINTAADNAVTAINAARDRQLAKVQAAVTRATR